MTVYPIIFVVATDKHQAIGCDGRLPWSAPKDLRTFQHITNHHPVIMGTKTWISIGRRPLKNRTNIILSRQMPQEKQTIIARSVDEAILKAKTAIRCHPSPAHPAIMVIGGRQIFEAFQDRATEAYVSVIELTVSHADTFLPDFIQNSWRISSSVYRYACSSLNTTHPKFSVYHYINPSYCNKSQIHDRRQGLDFLHEDTLNCQNDVHRKIHT